MQMDTLGRVAGLPAPLQLRKKGPCGHCRCLRASALGATHGRAALDDIEEARVLAEVNREKLELSLAVRAATSAPLAHCIDRCSCA